MPCSGRTIVSMRGKVQCTYKNILPLTLKKPAKTTYMSFFTATLLPLLPEAAALLRLAADGKILEPESGSGLLSDVRVT